ncbi:tetratricopeptide repeat protein, partial [Paracoccaceae bacterium]|nr:tetratricopeptide repeat protein [Paracoccaceae bacterium]
MQGNIDQPLRVGCENQQRDEYMSAELQYKLVLQKQPKNAAANHLMGLLKFKQGLFDEAVPFLKLALEIKPEEAQNWISYIDVLIKLKAIKDAQNMLDQAKEKGAKGKVFENLQEKIKQSNQANGIEGFEYEKPIEVERNFPVHDN